MAVTTMRPAGMSRAGGQMRVRVDVLGEAAVSRMLQRPADNSRDFSRSWDVILDEFSAMTDRQFASGGNEFGTPWADLAEGGPSTLQDTGELRASFQKGGAGHVRRVSGSSAEWGSDLQTPSGGWVLGQLHQHGTSRMPARVIFTLSETRRRRVVQILGEGLFADSRGVIRAPSGRFAALGLT